MRRVSRAGVILAIITILISGAAYADDPPPVSDPPGVRIGPPSGVTSSGQTPSLFDIFLMFLRVRIGPPTG